jgi:polyhydroxybutyrate depolymerase
VTVVAATLTHRYRVYSALYRVHRARSVALDQPIGGIMTRHGLVLACLAGIACVEPTAVEPAAAELGITDDSCPAPSALPPGVTHPRGLFRHFELSHDGVVRRFKVRVPAGYTGEAPVPLVFVNHALTQSGFQFGVLGSDMEAMADRAGFLAVFADGRFGSWNAGGCCGEARERGVDDVGFFRAMLAHVRGPLGLCVDRTRVYSTGLSNGGYLSYRLACEASDVFAAVASVAGGLAIDPAACAASQERPVPLLQIHGTADRIAEYRYAVESVADWAALSGCSATTVPAAQPASRLDTTCVTHTGCPAGVETTLCSVDDGGHCWFGNLTCGTGVIGGGLVVGRNARGIVAASAVWGFLSRFRCEECGQ